ncbi:hypothetical protein AB3S75_037621 [Citrus x aurantiifolia]
MADLQGFLLPFIICIVSLIVVQAIFRRTRIQSRLPPSHPHCQSLDIFIFFLQFLTKLFTNFQAAMDL